MRERDVPEKLQGAWALLSKGSLRRGPTSQSLVVALMHGGVQGGLGSMFLVTRPHPARRGSQSRG